ncbi:MAG TPA: hypothetical protein VK001_03120, partial [Geminicoccaceae bacterium]|nr:hypothetical protein [Geminicoccaceae bacterium]
QRHRASAVFFQRGPFVEELDVVEQPRVAGELPGRILEVTPEGDIVWQFVNPVRGGEQNDRIPIVCWAQRLDPDQLDPDVLGREA